jgi:pimeloyl-ACP methyl ester carboxylesterase
MWERVTPLLDAASVTWVAPDLPSCAVKGAGHTEDAAAVWESLDTLAGDDAAVLVGHSRGGIVISNVGAHPRVGNLVYIAALMLDEGQSSSEVIAPDFGDVRHRDSDGTTTFLPSCADVLMNDCTPEQQTWAFNRLRPQFAGAVPEPRYPWRSKPSTYVVCTLDRAIPPAGQRRMARNATSVLEWDTGHCPLVSRPDLVAGLLIRLAT